MKLFLRKFFFVVVVPAILFICYSAALFFNHRSLGISGYANTGEEAIISDPYNDNIITYLKRHKDFKNTKIIAMGSSRVLQFNAAMFKDEFYNLGYTSTSVFQITNLIKELELNNKTLIVGLDQWCFNSRYAESFVRAPKPHDFSTAKYFLKSMMNENRNMDIIHGKVYLNFSSSNDIQLIGTGANMALNGVLNDGSFYQGKIIQGKIHNDKELIGEDYDFADTRKRIKEGINRFEYADTISEETVQGIIDLMKECKIRNNKLVIFFPPFAPTVNQLLKISNKYKYMSVAAERTRDICSKNGISFYDFTNFESSDAEYIDGFHGGQQVYYKMAVQMGVNIADLKFLNAFENEHQLKYAELREAFFAQ